MKKRVQEYDCRDLPVIPNPKVEKTLESSFNNKYGGIHVLVAPTGSGKSTYMRSYANRFMADGGFVQYFSSELQNRKMFFTQFGDESRASDLFEVLPQKSVIILDQIEHLGELNSDISRLLKHLTYESRRVAGVSVIVSTSNIGIARDILELNGNDKIRINGSVSDWRWTHDMVDKYLEAPVYRNWSVADISIIRQLAYRASSPAFLYSFADLLRDYPSPAVITRLSQKAETFAEAWDKFKKTDSESFIVKTDSKSFIVKTDSAPHHKVFYCDMAVL